MDAKEAMQYVYCVCLTSDQGNGIGKEQVETAWELTRRIIVLANSGPAWEELVGGIRAEGGKFVRISLLFYKRCDLCRLCGYIRPVSSNMVHPSCISVLRKTSTRRSLYAQPRIRRRMTVLRKRSSCTTLRRTTRRSSAVSRRRWATPSPNQHRMRRHGRSRRRPRRF